jgi:hypothetical protein
MPYEPMSDQQRREHWNQGARVAGDVAGEIGTGVWAGIKIALRWWGIALAVFAVFATIAVVAMMLYLSS